MAASTRNSVDAGNPKSTGAKRPVSVAAGRSPRKATRVGGVSSEGSAGRKRSPAGGISGTTTGTGASTGAPSIPVATGRRPRTERAVAAGTPKSGKGAGCRVVSVCNVGPFAQIAFVAMPVAKAAELVGDIKSPGPTIQLDGVMRDLEDIRVRDEKLAGSAYAGIAVAMALEIENPYVSATAKSMCAGKLQEAMDRLRELLPPAKEENELDRLRAKREARLAGQSVS